MSEVTGDFSLILNIIAVILVSVGVFGRAKALIRHGYLSILGFALKLATVFAVMIPSIFAASSELLEFSAVPLGLIIVKVVLGIIGDVMGFVCIVPWFLKPLKQMNCNRVKRWMMPTFAIWIISIILGIIIHIGGIL